MSAPPTLVAGALAARGYPVRVLPDLGSRELVDQALSLPGPARSSGHSLIT